MTIHRLLVANRGEIARRVFATCRRLGIETVAVHSDADAGLPFVGEADYAVRLPGHTPAETYLDVEAMVAAAIRAGADAVHPGYGFLSENADFARAVGKAGLTWVGPAPESIEAMGSKVRAKELMRGAGVPVLEAPATPTDADLPLLVKASAGGGGRGMRVVRSLSGLADEIAAAAAEAASAFGDGTVFIEPYVDTARHVEVQILGTPDGVLVFGDRDCSVQRRHQKVVEEAPAPGLADEVRAALHEAARAAGEAIDYLGAGTVEFLYDPATERFFFLEMNTRLQVEHPVTEAVLGIDLVELQLAVAEGGAGCNAQLRAVQDRYHGPEEPITVRYMPRGHAIEVRLYAEDPAAGHQPQSGRLVTFEVPHEHEFAQPSHGVRVDSGFTSGDQVGTFYDAMLAKVIAWAPTREQAIRQLTGALRAARIHGLTTNREQLVAILGDPDFAAAELSTAFLDRELRLSQPDLRAAMLAATAALAEDARLRRTVQRGIPVAWRNVLSQSQVARFELISPPSTEVGEVEEVEWVGAGRYPGFPVADFEVLAITHGDHGYRVDYLWESVGSHATVHLGAGLPGHRVIEVDGALGHVRLREVPRFTDPAEQVASGSLLAPMPGTVVRVLVEQGAEVAAGDAVLVLEAMKMQHTVTAPTDGTVTEIDVTPGQQVAAGDVLAVVTGAEGDAQ